MGMGLAPPGWLIAPIYAALRRYSITRHSLIFSSSSIRFGYAGPSKASVALPGRVNVFLIRKPCSLHGVLMLMRPLYERHNGTQ